MKKIILATLILSTAITVHAQDEEKETNDSSNEKKDSGDEMGSSGRISVLHRF